MILFFSVKDMFIFGTPFVESGSCLIGLFELCFFASELQLQQHAAGIAIFSALCLSASHLILSHVVIKLCSLLDGNMLFI